MEESLEILQRNNLDKKHNKHSILLNQTTKCDLMFLILIIRIKSMFS
jgi:hypothetical protein